MIKKAEMNELINRISKTVDINELEIHEDSEENLIEISNKSDLQTIVIQIVEDGVWVRLREPCTGYFCDTVEEFEKYTVGLLTNKLEVCVGFKNDEWVETIIAIDQNYDELSNEFEYTISHWKA